MKTNWNSCLRQKAQLKFMKQTFANNNRMAESKHILVPPNREHIILTALIIVLGWPL